MELLRIKCRICAKAGAGMQNHAVITEFKNLPPNKKIVQCLACGFMGEELLDSQRAGDVGVVND